MTCASPKKSTPQASTRASSARPSTDVGAHVVVHTAGPFQAQNYSVPRACIDARAHYVDIADGRAYVCRIGDLDAEAKSNQVLVVSGASSLPALSSAVVDALCKQFSRIDSIEHGITSGAKPPGLATMSGVLSIGARWIANCDVPDRTVSGTVRARALRGVSRRHRLRREYARGMGRLVAGACAADENFGGACADHAPRRPRP